MRLLSLCFHPDGAARQRAALRVSPGGAIGACALDMSAGRWGEAAGRLLEARRHRSVARLLCEQVPPPAWALAIRLLGLERATTVFAERWPRRGERAPLAKAEWLFPTEKVAAAWGNVGQASSLSVQRAEARTTHAPGQAGSLSHGGAILWAGPLFARGAARSALWAFDIFAYLEPQAEMIVAGSGPGEATLRQFAAGLGPRERVRFVRSLDDVEWPKIRQVWVNDPTCAAPDVWHAARERGMPCLVAAPHAATGLFGERQGLPPHDPPAWAKSAGDLWTARARIAA